MSINYRAVIAALVLVGSPAFSQAEFPGQPMDAAQNAENAGGANWMAGLFHTVTGVPRPAGDPVTPVGHSFELTAVETESLQRDALSGPEYDVQCVSPWAHRSGVFAEFLYLRSRDGEVAYAVPVDGAIVPPPSAVQAGPVALVDQDYSPGFRAGLTCALDDCSSLVFTYSRFQGGTFDDVTETAPLVIRSLVLHPGTANAGADFLDASANLDVGFDIVDADYRAVWSASDVGAVN
jgi:hypothetical protein